MKSISIDRRTFLTAAAMSISRAVFSENAAENIPHPNLIIVLADDLGYSDLGCYGGRDIQTPHIDRLAKWGIRLTDAYAAAPVCTPTRCALVSGCYPQRQENLEWAIYPQVQSVGLNPGQATLASMLRDAGYKTGMFGKWHLGRAEKFNPVHHGFDEFFGFLGGNIDYFLHRDRFGNSDLFEKTKPIEKEGYITDLITKRSVDFIHQNAGNPFFLYVAYNAPHWPIQGPDEKDVILEGDDFHQRGDRKTYARMVERMDDGVGQILDSLKRDNLETETLVVFLSDNGGDRLSSNEPLRDKKTTLWEGGIRVPCIFSWPGVLPEGRVSHQAAITMDTTVSLLAAAGVKPARRVDGMNLLPYIAGIRPDVEQTFVWRNNWHGQKAVRWGKWKWLKMKEEEFLFNLQEDMSERIDRKDRNIDIVYWLREIYRQWESAMPYNQSLFGEELRQLDKKVE